MRIVIIHRAQIQKRPPVVSLLKIIIDLGYHPILITTGINKECSEYLTSVGVEVIVVNFSLSSSVLRNAMGSYFWGRNVSKVLRDLSKRERIMLWIEGNYTFVALGRNEVQRYPYILQHQEMFGRSLEKMVIKQLIGGSIVNVIPEYNRAQLYKMFFDLKELPTILPNKPYFQLDEIGWSELKNKYTDLYHLLSGKKIILFQGGLSKERDLTNYIKALSLLDSSYSFVLLGKDYGMVEKYKRLREDIIYIPHIDAPDYLFITSMAYIGIITYSSDKLNTLYCAPNKIFEYSAFGIPIVGNDIPGLRYTVEYNGFGMVCDDTDVKEIAKAIEAVANNYSSFSENAVRFYKSIDNKNVVSKIVDIAKNRLNCKFK